MRQSVHTDYSIRVLMYLGVFNERLVNIDEIAKSYDISKNHLTKVVHNLAKADFIHSIRGRNGGIRLARPPKNINLKEVVITTEEDFNMVECFNQKTNKCVITGACQLGDVFSEALGNYLQTLAQYSLADLLKNNALMKKSLQRRYQQLNRIEVT